MMIVEMTADSKATLLREIQTIQSDVWELKSTTVSELENYIELLDHQLDNFIDDLEAELTEYEK